MLRYFPQEPRKEASQYITYSGFYADEVVSACQKAVRRGWDEAYQWFLELFWSVKAHRTWAWNRMLVMCVEDIGPADPNCLKEVYFEYINDRDNPLAMCFACEKLLKSKKTRVADWAVHFIEDDGLEETSLSQALEEGNISRSIICAQRLHSAKRFKDIWNAFLDASESNYIDMVIEIANNKYFKGKDVVRLFWSFLIFLTISGTIPEDNLVDIERNLDRFIPVVNKHLYRYRLVGIPDVAIDKHTARGKRMKRGFDHFLQHGSKLENTDEEWEELSRKIIAGEPLD